MKLFDPKEIHPIKGKDGSVFQGTVHLAPLLVDHPQFEVGDWTYASDFEPPEDVSEWPKRLAPYLFPFSQERLTLGKFCQIAHGVRFVTASASHPIDGASTYPFAYFGEGAKGGPAPDQRDTVVGHDVWFGMGAMICPGAQIGDGAIIGAGAVVRGTVPPYAVVTGNPGVIHKMRFDPRSIARLRALAWWDWPAEVIAEALPSLERVDLDRLEAIARQVDATQFEARQDAANQAMTRADLTARAEAILTEITELERLLPDALGAFEATRTIHASSPIIGARRYQVGDETFDSHHAALTHQSLAEGRLDHLERRLTELKAEQDVIDAHPAMQNRPD